MRPSLRGRLLERRARRTARRVGVVLVYHRIGEYGGASAALSAEVPSDTFVRQLAHLAARYRVVPLADLITAVAERRAGDPFPVALTFDDDLESHASIAALALEEAQLPATFFLTGVSLEETRSLWWDDLAQAIDTGALEEPGLPADLVTDARAGSVDAVKALARAVEELPSGIRADVAARLRAQAGAPRDRGLRVDDIRSLARAGFEIGFHTLAHDVLVSLPNDALAAALRDGRAALESAAGAKLSRIAYPHGRADSRVASAASASGFVEGYTGAAMPVVPGANRLLLPRYQAAWTLEGLSFQVAHAVSDGRDA